MFKKLFLYIVIFICVAGVLVVGDKFIFSAKTDGFTKTATQTLMPAPTTETLPEGVSYLSIGNQTFEVEIADTPAKQQQGLSDRAEIGSDGMLFPFSPPAQPRFWMKDMLMDLDFIWIANGQVVEITPNVSKPDLNAPQDTLLIYQPAQPVDAMLEVVAGFVQTHNIVVGQTVTY